MLVCRARGRCMEAFVCCAKQYKGWSKQQMSITTPNLIVTDPATYLKNRFQTQTAQIAIVGLGYVGLPMAIEFVHAGFSVVGIDIDPERCDTLAQGRSYIADVTDEDIAKLFATKRFRAVS